MDNAYVYILQCSDGSYYVGLTRRSPEARLAEQNLGHFDGYTKRRRPVRLVYAHAFERIVDAIAAEQKLKGWSRAKKVALIRGDIASLKFFSKRKQQ